MYFTYGLFNDGKEEHMKLRILGSGCSACEQLAENVQAAAQQCGMAYDLDKVTDVVEIASYGVMSMPALAIDGRVVSSGSVLSVEQVVVFLQNAGSEILDPHACACGDGGCDSNTPKDEGYVPQSCCQSVGVSRAKGMRIFSLALVLIVIVVIIVMAIQGRSEKQADDRVLPSREDVSR